MSGEAVIVAAARSPIGRAYKGSLRDLRADDLAAHIIGVALDQVPQLDRSEIEDLMLGCGRPGGEQGFNMARVVAVLAGMDHVPGVTLTRYCASSLQTTRMAMHAIRAGEGDVFVSAGVEVVSHYRAGTSDSLPVSENEDPRDSSKVGWTNPVFADAQARTQRRTSEQADLDWVDPREQGLLPDVYIAMGQTAENIANRWGISREEQDTFACRSQNRAEAAIKDGFWAREITPVTTPGGDVVSSDDGIRPGTTMEALAALKPVFRPHGTVTAGNACPLNDGAAALLVMSDRKARELEIEPLARIVATGVCGVSPEIMGMGPVEASRRALGHAGMTIEDVDLVEINEAFAVQVLASASELGIDQDKLNVHGGAIAVGHPFGMTGARIATTLLNGLRSRDATIGLETMCVGGGQGMAMILERLN